MRQSYYVTSRQGKPIFRRDVSPQTKFELDENQVKRVSNETLDTMEASDGYEARARIARFREAALQAFYSLSSRERRIIQKRLVDKTPESTDNEGLPEPIAQLLMQEAIKYIQRRALPILLGQKD